MKSLERKIAEHIPRLRRYARALLGGDRQEADDLVQDCLERALSRGHRWRPGSDLRAWLFTIMHNLFVNRVRRRERGPEFIGLSQEPEAGPRRPEEGLLLRDLERALEALPPDQREILLLVSLEGMRYEEVAGILELPVGTVMSRLSRARKGLRRRIWGDRDQHLRRIK